MQRVMPGLMGMKNILVLNDEGHHCYRRKPGGKTTRQSSEVKSGEKPKRTPDEARVWISGLESIKRKLGVRWVIDLSATPFFLKGSRLPRRDALPMDSERLFVDGRHRVRHREATACARVPTTFPAETCPSTAPFGRTSAPRCPKRDEASPRISTPLARQPSCRRRCKPLYGHYEKIYHEWRQAGIPVPPCFIIVCNNTSTSKLVYDYVSRLSPRK